MFDWLNDHRVILGWVAGASVVLFVGTLIVVPILVVQIPPDYFVRERRPHARWEDQHPIVRGILIGLKNLLGAVFLLAGIAMLALPGQGLITMVIGIMLLDFPGKYKLERWVVRRRLIGRAINWMRTRAHHPPLEIPGDDR